MAERRVKVTGEAAKHRTGTARAAIKPHKSTPAAGSAAGSASATGATGAGATTSSGAAAAPRPTSAVKAFIYDYMGKLRSGSLVQTTWGTTVEKNAPTLRKYYALAASDDPYLLLDASNNGSGKAGVLLSTTGVRLADGRGSVTPFSWKQLQTTELSYQAARSLLVIGQSGVMSRDAAVLADLLQQIKAKRLG